MHFTLYVSAWLTRQDGGNRSFQLCGWQGQRIICIHELSSSPLVQILRFVPNVTHAAHVPNHMHVISLNWTLKRASETTSFLRQGEARQNIRHHQHLQQTTTINKHQQTKVHNTFLAMAAPAWCMTNAWHCTICPSCKMTCLRWVGTTEIVGIDFFQTVRLWSRSTTASLQKWQVGFMLDSLMIWPSKWKQLVQCSAVQSVQSLWICILWLATWDEAKPYAGEIECSLRSQGIEENSEAAVLTELSDCLTLH